MTPTATPRATLSPNRGPTGRRRRGGLAVTLVVAATVLVGVLALPTATRTASRLGWSGSRAGDDGALDRGATVFDDGHAGIAALDPTLRQALRDASTEAADAGVTITVTSGWRSPEHQARLLREAEERYGSAQEAARWVATPETSAHVSGDAVDVGPSAAVAWLVQHGAAHGLCQVYDNEPWHFELRPDAVADGCPATYSDPTHDPRLR